MTESILDLTVAAARFDDEVLETLVQMTGLTLRTIDRRLRVAHGRMHVRRVFEAELPLDYDALRTVSVAEARAWGLREEIARVWEISPTRVEEVLGSVHGRTFLRRAFGAQEEEEEEWEEDEEEEEEEATAETAAENGDGADDEFSDLGEHWSRPRRTPGVLDAVGLGVPTRLRSERFQAMLAELGERGVEACLADDPTLQVLDVTTPSPGIAAKLRLRKRRSDAPLVAELGADRGNVGSEGWSNRRPVRSLFAQLGMSVPDELGQDEFAALIEALELRGYEVATADGARLSPLHDAVPLDAELRLRHDALASPPASVRATTADLDVGVTGPRGEKVSDYERAVLRLELLTAGGESLGRSQEWVIWCVETATGGLSISAARQEVLGWVGRSLARTPRDPLAVLTSLVRRIDPEDGEVLLDEYARLHPERPEAIRLLRAHWSALCGTG